MARKEGEEEKIQPTFPLQTTISNLATRVEELLKKQQQDNEHESEQKRVLIGLAGVPGSGKSTVSKGLMEELEKRGVDVRGRGGEVVVVPMDGFHHTKSTLRTFPDADEAFRRRGAPFTFDADAFVDLVLRLKNHFPVTTTTTTTSSSSPSQEEEETFLYAPSFDHAVQDPVPDAIAISSKSRVVIVEGNYTLLDVEPWKRLRGVWDQKWFVDADPEVVTARLVKRHLAAGIETNAAKAQARVEGNDLVNGRVVREALGEVDVVIRN